MDPLAHTLVGATLAETTVGRTTARAVPMLILAANAPDIDAVTMFVSRDLSLGFRRGWTHGVLSLMILPLLLAGLVLLADRAIAHARQRPARARAGPLIALGYLGILTHPALDWLNTYGVRLLMPFDGRWFYGDALFIVDPWLWLLASATVVLAHSEATGSRAAWVSLGLLSTALVTGVAGVPSEARVAWLVGIGVICGLRAWGGVQPGLMRRRMATGCLGAAMAYIATMVIGSRLAADQARTWLAEHGETATAIMAGPIPANPFVRDIVVVDDTHYHFLELHWLGQPLIRPTATAIDRGPRGPIIEAALEAPHLQGLTTWMRFPAFGVEDERDGYRVTVQDVRYMRRRDTNLGTTVVYLDQDLNIREGNGR